MPSAEPRPASSEAPSTSRRQKREERQARYDPLRTRTRNGTPVSIPWTHQQPSRVRVSQSVSRFCLRRYVPAPPLLTSHTYIHTSQPDFSATHDPTYSNPKAHRRNKRTNPPSTRRSQPSHPPPLLLPLSHHQLRSPSPDLPHWREMCFWAASPVAEKNTLNDFETKERRVVHGSLVSERWTSRARRPIHRPSIDVG